MTVNNNKENLKKGNVICITTSTCMLMINKIYAYKQINLKSTD